MYLQVLSKVHALAGSHCCWLPPEFYHPVAAAKVKQGSAATASGAATQHRDPCLQHMAWLQCQDSALERDVVWAEAWCLAAMFSWNTQLGHSL
mmetsp:Transcript_10438/g.22414  ORF Transcript_10438/g.22414 Transcript_10438/m.22414 type:complete len:93 (-) Transcript_10438:568-846(-)